MSTSQTTPTPTTSASTSASTQIIRTTMFKIPSPTDQDIILDQYRETWRTAQKNSNPYLLSLSVTRLSPDARSQDFTLAIRTVFASREDMAYYDEECEAHKKLKGVAMAKKVGDVLTVWGREEVRCGEF